MEPITWTDFFVSMMPTIFLILLWLIPVLLAFAHLRNQVLDDTARALWVIIILTLPVVGALTYLMLFRQKNSGSVK